jgi:hypothetical protein
MKPTPFVLVAAFALAASGLSSAATLEIHPYLREGDSADLVVLVDGKQACAVKIAKAAADVHRKPACRFELPASASRLGVRGTYEGVRWSTKKRYRHEGEQSWPLVDFAPAGSRLAQPGKSYGERVADFLAAANAFAGRQLGADYVQSIEGGKPASAAAIAAAEKRLGYALPADFVSIQRTVGALRIGDHGLMSIEDVADADTQMRKVWGTPEDAMQESYSDKARANLRASTLLFTEVGDGYGGLRYRPAPTGACGEQPFYQWISQEGSDKALRHADGRCMDFAAAFRWLIEGFVLEDYADELASEKGALLIDSSAGVQPLALDTSDERFAVSLSVRWQGPNGLWRSPEAP